MFQLSSFFVTTTSNRNRFNTESLNPLHTCPKPHVCPKALARREDPAVRADLSMFLVAWFFVVELG